MVQNETSVPTQAARYAADASHLINLRLLGKLKAGFGAAGLAAVLAEGLFSSGWAARTFGLAVPVAERLGGMAVVFLSLAAFFVASLFSDVADGDAARKPPITLR